MLCFDITSDFIPIVFLLAEITIAAPSIRLSNDMRYLAEVKKLDNELSLFTTKFDIGDQVKTPDGNIGKVIANRSYSGLISEFKETFDSEVEFASCSIWFHRYQLKLVI